MIITFYSYKGGVGRSQLCANVATYLSLIKGKKILLMDWDFEAPGLHYFFEKTNSDVKSFGTIELLQEYCDLMRTTSKVTESLYPKIENRFITNLLRNDSPDSEGLIDLIPAGNYLEDYGFNVNTFDWFEFYELLDGKVYIEFLKKELKKLSYDFIFIDSRTGVNDYSGICNIQFPDSNVVVMAANNQNIEGCRKIINSIYNSEYTKKGYREAKIFPILSRINVNHPDYNAWTESFTTQFSYLLSDLDSQINDNFSRAIFKDFFIDKTVLADEPKYSAGENLLFESPNTPIPKNSFRSKFANLGEYLLNLDIIGSIEISDQIDPESWEKWGKKAAEDGMDYEAAFAFEKAGLIELSLDHGGTLSLFTNLGDDFILKGDLNAALTSFEKALYFEPNSRDLLMKIADIFLLIKREERAINIYDRIIRENENDWECLSKKGKALVELNNIEEGIKYLKISLELKKAPITILELAKAYIKKKQLLDAISVLNEIPKESKFYIEALYIFILCFQRINNSNKIIEKGEELINIEPSNNQIRHLLGKIYFDLSELAKAKKHLEQTKGSPFWPQSNLLIGHIYYLEDAHELALKAYKNYIVNNIKERNFWENFIEEIRKLESKGINKKSIDKLINQLRTTYDLELPPIQIARQEIEIAKREKLTRLHLSELGLQEIPEEIQDLKNLTFLDISENQISEIKNLEGLANLRHLKLRNNRISEIKGLDELKELSYLNLSFNRISEIKGLDKLKELSYLNLSFNRILEIKDLDNLTNLNNFLLVKNKIKEIKGLDNLKNLTSLRLAFNNIKEIRGLDNLVNLNRLDLFENKITKINRLDNLVDVTHINLASNRINKLDDSILPFIEKNSFSLRKNDFFNIENNPIISPPLEILQQGSNAIKAYFEEIKNAPTLNEVKVIVVGEGAVGKTSLVKRIINQEFDSKEKQTHGIHINKKAFEIQNQKLNVNFWDFGGQEIMHSTHQFFLTKRCLYLLVLDSRKDEMVEYWLRYIESFGGDAEVVIVLNKIDENPSFDVDRRFLCEKYPNIKKFFKVSCKSGNGLKELKFYLLDALWNMDLRDTPFPDKWFGIKNHFQNMKEDYVSYDYYKQICIEHGVTDPIVQSVLLRFLNDLGIVLNYEKIRFNSTQVLNPLWLTNAVYRVINSKVVVINKGKLNITKLDDILNDPNYKAENPDFQEMHISKDKHAFIIDMMEEFELAYQITKNQYIIPELLPIEQNLYAFDEEDTILRFIIEYPDFLPTSIIPRLMIKLHKYIHKNQVWKNGMVLEEKLFLKAIANITLDKEKAQVIIEIVGKRRREFLTMIRVTIREINASFQKLDIIEWIPLPEKHKDEELLVNYEELIGYEEARMNQYFSGRLRKSFLVEDLLNGVEPKKLRNFKKTIRLFISYSHQDIEYKDELKKHLMPLVRINKAHLWDDSHINAGEELNEKIFSNLEAADIVLCLISPDFIVSDFCNSKELQAVVDAYEVGKKIVIPIRIRKCNWSSFPISGIQSVPSKWLEKPNNDKAWTEVAKEIEKAINKIQEEYRWGEGRDGKQWFSEL